MSGMAGGGIFGIIIMIIIALFGGGDLFGRGWWQHALQKRHRPASPKPAIRPRTRWLNSYPSYWHTQKMLGHKNLRTTTWEYVEPTLVLFSGQVQSACGVAGSQVGPFYCPADQKIIHRLEFSTISFRREYGASGRRLCDGLRRRP